MKRRLGTLISLIVISSLLCSCYSMNGWINESRELRSELKNELSETVMLPQDDSVSISEAVFDGKVLKVKADVARTCELQTKQTYRNEMEIQRSLPASYWVWYSLSYLGLAGGATMGGLGTAWVVDGKSRPIGTHAQESRRDKGDLLMPIGFSLLGLSAILVGVQSYDLYKARNTKEARPDELRVVKGPRKVCKTEPASNVQLSFDVKGTKRSISLDNDGRGSLTLDDPGLLATPFATPFASITCPGCKPYVVDLPDGLAADWVLAHNTLDEYKLWLDKYPRSSRHAEVTAAYERYTTTERNRLQAIADGFYREAQAAAKTKSWGDVHALSARCLEVVPAHNGCLTLSANASASIPQMERISETAILHEGSGWIMYFALADKGDNQVAVPGYVEYAISVCDYSGSCYQTLTIKTESIRESDFERRVIGLGNFARPSLLHKIYMAHDEFRDKTTPSFAPPPSDMYWYLSASAHKNALFFEVRFTGINGKKLVGRKRFTLE